MRLDRPWPSWHPNQELKADHLIGLEDFLLARAVLADEEAHGVDLFNWRSDLEIRWTKEGLRASVRRLRGVTPAGEPVCVTTGENLSALYSSSPEASSGRNEIAAAMRVLEWDMRIDVNPRGSEPRASEPVPPAKLVLHLDAVAKNAAPVRPFGHTHSLYLGRYRLHDNAHEIVHQPLMRRLGTLEPRDEFWTLWVNPLRTRIEALAAQVEPLGGRQDMSQLVVAAEILRLTFDWPSVPIPALARRLRFIAWLIAGRASTRSTDVAAALDPFSMTEMTGAELPKRLANLLPDQIEVVGSELVMDAVGEPTTLPLVTSQLIGALRIHDVDYHAPVELLERWSSELSRLQTTGCDPADTKALCEQLKDSGRGLASGVESSWVSAIMLVTAAGIEVGAGEGCPPEVLERLGRFRSEGPAFAAARALNELYDGAAKQRRAGPLAFYYLARAAAGIPEVQNAAKKNLPDYLDRLGGERPRPQVKPKPGQPHSATFDRVFAYLGAVSESDQRSGRSRPIQGIYLPTGRRFTGRSDTSRQRSAGHLSEIKIALVGPPGSGKSTLLRQMCIALSVATTQLPEIRLDPPRADDSGNLTAVGTVSLQANTLPLTVVELPGALMDAAASFPATTATKSRSSLLCESLRDSDLVIVTLDPASMDSPTESRATLGELATVTHWLFENAPNCRVALAYTKADEYGVVTPDALRIAEESQAALLPRLGEKRVWREFANGGVDTHERHEFSIIRKPGAALSSAECAPTRTWLLEKTKPLWEAIAGSGEGKLLLNGYFICAHPCDQRFARAEDRGFLQVLADFVLCLGALAR